MGNTEVLTIGFPVVLYGGSVVAHGRRRPQVTNINPGESRIEKMLGIEFASDPRLSRFPLPRVPEGHPTDRPYPHPQQTVTPDMAKDWLTYRVIRKEVTPKALLHDDFCANRKFIIANLTGSSSRKGLIAKLRDDEWNEGVAQGLIFTPDGFLLDGQHRLAACVLAKKPIEIMISQAPWTSFAATDDGRARTASQLLDIPYASQATAIVRYLVPGVEGTDREEFQRKDMGRQEIIDMVMSWPDLQGPWMGQIALANQNSKVPATPLGAAVIAALACDADPDMIQRFLNGLMKNFNPKDYTGSTDPRWMLLKLYQNTPARGDAAKRLGNTDQRGNAGLLRYALGLWLDGKEVGQMSRTSPSRALPTFWHGEKLAAYHADHLS